MYRRGVLAGVAALATAGCVGGAGDGAGGDPTDSTGAPTETSTPTPTRTTAGLSAVTLTPRGSCPDPGDATVRLDAEPVSVVGCVVGKNGCTRPRLAAVDRDAGAVTVVIAAVEERDDDEACTEALVNLGYEVRIDGDEPTSVTVVHDDVGGRRTVVDVTR